MLFRAVLDANVLVPARTRDVLLSLAEAGFFVPLWSEEILDEVARHLPERMSEGWMDRQGWAAATDILGSVGLPSER